MRRKLLLVILLVSAIGLGSGYFSDDLCALGGSYIDDPTSPGVTAQFALPNHRQAAPKAAAHQLTVLPEVITFEPLHTTQVVSEADSTPSPSSPVPIRC